MLTRSVALVVFGVVAGAGFVLLADPGSEPVRTIAPATLNAAATGVSADGHDHSSAGLTGDTACEESGPPVSKGQTEHGHRGPFPWKSITDSATRDELRQQLAIAHDVTVKFPTVATAEAAGYRMTTGYVPCIGAHYINAVYLVGKFDPAHPAMLLYDGTKPDSKMVGLSYASMSGKAAPEGFAGTNDIWHQHNLNGGLCLKGGVVVGAESTTPEECKARGGFKVALDSLWMNHTWVADGWPSSWGIFSAEHPDLGATPEGAGL